MFSRVTTFIYTACLLLVTPLLALGQTVPAVTVPAGTANPLGTYLVSIITFANSVLIPFVLGIGFLFFVWGMFLYFIKGGNDEDAQKTGKSYIVYAIAGFVIIFIFWGVVNLITGSTGLNTQPLTPTLIPNAPSTRTQ